MFISFKLFIISSNCVVGRLNIGGSYSVVVERNFEDQEHKDFLGELFANAIIILYNIINYHQDNLLLLQVGLLLY